MTAPVMELRTRRVNRRNNQDLLTSLGTLTRTIVRIIPALLVVLMIVEFQTRWMLLFVREGSPVKQFHAGRDVSRLISRVAEFRIRAYDRHRG